VEPIYICSRCLEPRIASLLRLVVLLPPRRRSEPSAVDLVPRLLCLPCLQLYPRGRAYPLSLRLVPEETSLTSNLPHSRPSSSLSLADLFSR
jgi:hypothetical protein